MTKKYLFVLLLGLLISPVMAACSFDYCVYKNTTHTFTTNNDGIVIYSVPISSNSDEKPIQAAIDNMTNGTLYINQGTYNINASTIRYSGTTFHYYTGIFIDAHNKSISIKGAGTGSTILRLNGEDILGPGVYSHYPNHPALIMLNSNEGLPYRTGHSSFGLSGITFDGNQANQQYDKNTTDGSGCFLAGGMRYNATYSNLEFKNSSFIGFYSGNNAAGWDNNATFDTIYAHDNLAIGLQFDTTHYSTISNITTSNNGADWGIWINGNGANYRNYLGLDSEYKNISMTKDGLGLKQVNGSTISNVTISRTDSQSGLAIIDVYNVSITNITIVENEVLQGKPFARFITNATSGIGPLTVAFFDISNNLPTTWNWSFRNVMGNDTQVWFSATQNPVHTFGVGNFSIVLNASNSDGYNLSTQITFINVTAVPALVTNATDTTGVYRPGVGFYLRNSNTGGNADVVFGYGNLAGDIPLAGDWTGVGRDTIGVYRNGVFYLRNSNTGGIADLAFPYGQPGDVPVVGDWDGNGVDTIGVYRNGVFYLRNSNTGGIADLAFPYGQPGDVPVSSDWDGNGVDTIGVFRNGVFYLRNSNTKGIADLAFAYGQPGDVPVSSDWDGNGVDTIGVYRNGVFYLRNSNTKGIADLAFAYGQPGDVPVSSDWDGM